MPPDLIDRRFQLEREVGGGGMGRIWRARDTETGRTVAVKIMSTDVPTAVERFHREAVTLASIRHPGIVDYIAHGVVEGRPYIAMEWLDGIDLARRLRNARSDRYPTVPARLPAASATVDQSPLDRLRVGLPIREIVVMARRLASALGEIHARGVVHRDLKPENVFLLDGDLTRAKLIDFGVARGVAHAAA